MTPFRSLEHLNAIFSGYKRTGNIHPTFKEALRSMGVIPQPTGFTKVSPKFTKCALKR